MNLNDVMQEIKELITEEISDPISRRLGKWVYDDESRIELDKTPFPKILISPEPAGEQKTIRAIGMTQQTNELDVNVQIKAESGKQYTLGDKKYTAKDFCSKISEEIETMLKDKNYNTDNISIIRPLSEDLDYDQELNPTYTLTLRVKFNL